MTNYEKYKIELIDILSSGGLAVVNGRPADCCSTKCDECDFGNSKNYCVDLRKRWLNLKCN